MKKFKLLRTDLAEKHLTPAEKKKREEIAMAMEREHPGMPMGKKMAIATAAAKKVAEENLDELKNSTLDSYIDKVSTGPSRGNTQTGIPKSIKAIGGTTTAIRKRIENIIDSETKEKQIKEEKPGLWANIHAKRERIKNGSGEHMRKPGSKGAPSAQDFKDAAKTSKNEEYTIDEAANAAQQAAIAINMKKRHQKPKNENIEESVKTTHEDPLVTVHHTDGELWTHANLSVANAIHKTKVSHHAVHAGPTKSGDWTFNISKHHDKAVKDDAKVKHQVDEDALDELTLSFGSHDKKPAPVAAKLADMKKYFANNDKDQIKQNIKGKKFNDMSEYETWLKTNKVKPAMQVASFEQDLDNTIEESSYTFEPATHSPTVRNSRGHSFEGNTYNAKGLKGASIYKHKDTGKYYADKISAGTTFHSSAEEAAEKYHNKAK